MGCLFSKHCTGRVPHSPKVNEVNVVGVVDAERTIISSISSDVPEVEDKREVPNLNITRDSNGITRLSRISSQTLPSEGSCTVRVRLGNYELSYSYLSQRGYYPEALDKPNQDSYCIHSSFGENPDDHFFGVFDGHGEFGAECSQFVKQRLCENLLRNTKLHFDPVDACHAAFLTTNTQLHSDYLDDAMSGTTAITILVRGRTMYVANAGDSRAVIAEKRGEDIVAMDVSIDQTPFRDDELERVKSCGARVMTLDQIEGLKDPDVQCWGTEEADDGDPPRLWVQDGMYPGTAFTRSIGDSIAESIGVIATPEIFVMELTSNHPFFVIASDGVFEFLSSQAVVDMVAKFKDPHEACAAVVAESYRRWLQYETRTDDITIIVVHVKGLTDVANFHPSPEVPATPLHQVVEVTGSESPSAISHITKNRVRNISRSRLRETENPSESGLAWIPPAPSRRKTWEEEAHIENALHDHFLFRKLTDAQFHVLLDCMQRVEVKSGDVVVKQGGEGECFYVVGSGEFEVVATQEVEGNEPVTRVLHCYTADTLSTFGELALMYNKPLQASVRALIGGTLWALKRDDFRGVILSESFNLASLKLLRSVEVLSRLTILQLSSIADNILEMSFSDGQVIIEKSESLSALYIIQKGKVRLTCDPDLLSSGAICILPASHEVDQTTGKNGCIEMTEGSYFGERVLLGECISSLSAVSIGDALCSVITKEKFDSIVGPSSKLQQAESKLKFSSNSAMEPVVSNGCAFLSARVQLSDLEWRTSIYATEYCEIGPVLLKGSDNILTLKRFSRKRIKLLGSEGQVIKERDLMTSLKQSRFFPQVLCTCSDPSYVGILLNCHLICPLSSVLRIPLDEHSAQFYAASVVVALEELHKNFILYRGLSPDMLLLNHTGHIQLVDFRYGKKMTGERTFTLCGIADTSAPEIVERRGHGFPADWWSLGVLIYFMLMPSVSWRDGVDIYARVAKGQLGFPQAFSAEVIDLISKLLQVDDGIRLGCEGPDSIRSHPWFNDVDWERIADGTFPVPQDIRYRIDALVESHVDDVVAPASPPYGVEELNSPEWLQGW